MACNQNQTTARMLSPLQKLITMSLNKIRYLFEQHVVLFWLRV